MSTRNAIAAQIVDLINSEHWSPATHLKAQALADRFKVSRQPINEALALLHEQGFLTHERHRGYYLIADVRKLARLLKNTSLVSDADEGSDPISRAYYQIAEDRLQGALPGDISEAELRKRYYLTISQSVAVLTRISQEGWASRKPGYGWSFSDMLTTPDSLMQSYRLRLATEPAALLEPGYKLDPNVLQRCREAELHLLNGGIKSDSAEQLHDRGVRFHEALVEASGNVFFIESIRRVNRVRRLLSYRSTRDRTRYEEHCLQHLAILDLLEKGEQKKASAALYQHLESTLKNISRLYALLENKKA